ncbi:MAG: DUF503 domain-containing protein [Myxococcota bacterium]
MVVGVLKMTLGIEGAYSLKEKRGVVRRVLSRLKNRFDVAAAEVGDLDLYNRATLGVVAVSNDASLVNSVLDQVVDATESIGAGMADLLDTQLEILHL